MGTEKTVDIIPEPKPEPEKPDPPQVTDAYRKVHKQYGIFTALFLAYELIGIDVKDKPLPNVDVTFRSPEAVPYVLIVLMFYFAYRLTVEWLQCDKERRTVKVSRFDYFLAHGIAVMALAIFAYQTVTKFQIADSFHWYRYIMLMICIYASIVWLFVGRKIWKRSGKIPFMYTKTRSLAFIVLVGFTVASFGSSENPFLSAGGVVVGSIGALLLLSELSRHIEPSAHSSANQ